MQIQRLPFSPINRLGGGSKENPIGDALDKLTISPLQLGMDLLDTSMGIGYATNSVPDAFRVGGYVAGAAHGALAAGYLLGAIDRTSEVAHARVSKAFGNALLAVGHISGAAGAGIWSWAPLVGGMVVTTLQDYRDRNP